MDSTIVIFLIGVLVFAFLMSYVITPLIRKLSIKVGAVDVPKDERRMHDKPVPTMGGVAIFIAFAIGLLFFVPMEQTYAALLGGAAIIVVVGMLDDIYTLKWWIKLSGQFLAAIVVVLNGVVIDMFAYKPIEPTWLIPILTIAWIVIITNTINLLDGLDGLACGIAAISCIALLIVSTFSVSLENQSVMFVIAILAGACFGFLPYNISPAKIFMGDTGAMFIGFALSVISIQGFFKIKAIVSFGVPFLVLAIPILDTIVAFIRRTIKKQHFFQADKKHFHHKLIDMGFNQRQTVLLLYAISALLCVAAVLFALPERRFLEGGFVMLGAFIVGVIAINRISHKNRQGNEKKKGQEDKENQGENRG